MKNTKRFFREFLLTSLPMGGALALYSAIDHKWWISIVVGAIIGGLLGLFIAAMNAIESSRSTHPVKLKFVPLDLPETSKYESRPRFSAVLIMSALLGIVILLAVTKLLRSPATSDIYKMVFIITASIMILIPLLMESLFAPLIISKDGIEYHSVFYKLKVRWENVVRIEQRRKQWYLISQSSDVIAGSLISKWLKFIEADKRIFLDFFASDFLESELAKAILQHYDQISIVSTA